MIKIYSMDTCPYCVYVKRQVEGNPEFEVVDIAAHVHNLAEFMHLRDSNAVFDRSKAIGDVGIPAFLLPDGTVTLKPEDVGLVEWDGTGNPAEGASCALGGHGC